MSTENLPEMNLPIFGADREKLSITPLNSELCTYVGKLSMYDHVWVVLPDTKTAEEPEGQGMRIFKLFHTEAYETMVRFMIANAYPLFMNQRTVCNEDMEDYERILEVSELDEFDGVIPDDWGSVA